MKTTYFGSLNLADDGWAHPEVRPIAEKEWEIKYKGQWRKVLHEEADGGLYINFNHKKLTVIIVVTYGAYEHEC